MKKTGVPDAYFDVLEKRSDLLLEAEVEEVSRAVKDLGNLLGVGSLRLERDVASGSDPDQKSQIRIFRLQGQSWTQVMCPFIPSSSFEPGKVISKRLSCRCFYVEVTDDAWGGHVLFDPKGGVSEIQWRCVGDDLKRFLPRLGMPVPEMEEDELYEETEFFWSQIRADATEGDLAALVELLDLWVDPGTAVWALESQLERLDLLYTI